MRHCGGAGMHTPLMPLVRGGAGTLTGCGGACLAEAVAAEGRNLIVVEQRLCQLLLLLLLAR